MRQARTHNRGESLALLTLLALVVGAMAANTNTNVTGLLLPDIAEDFGHSVGFMGSFRAVAAATGLIVAFPLSRYADQFPRKHLILLGLGCMLASGLLALTATNLAHFIGYYLFAGASEVILFAMLLAAASDYVEGHGLDRANGVIIGAMGVPGFLLVPLAGVVADEYGWRHAYTINISVAAVGVLLVLLLLPRVPPSGDEPESMLAHLRMLSSKPGLVTIIASNVMRFTIVTSLTAFTASFLVEEFDLTEGNAGLYFAIGSVAFLLAAAASGVLINRLGLWKIMIPGGLILIGALLLAYIPTHPSGILTGVGLIIAGSLLSIQENGALGTILRLAPDARGAATSMNELGAAVAAILGALVSGLVIQLAGFHGFGIFMAALAICALYLTRRALQTARSIAEAHTATSLAVTTVAPVDG